MSKKPLLYVPDSPHYTDPFRDLFEVTRSDLKKCDVVMFTGGSDISPAFYGQKPNKFTMSFPARDAKEKVLYDWALEHKKKFLGICRGAQFLCAMAGGKLAQHINGHGMGSHRMTASDGESYLMSTLHHQMMIPKGTNHELLAWTEKLSKEYYGETSVPLEGIDTEPEVVYFKDICGLGIQGHPEFLRPGGDKEHARTLKYLHKTVQERLL